MVWRIQWRRGGRQALWQDQERRQIRLCIRVPRRRGGDESDCWSDACICASRRVLDPRISRGHPRRRVFIADLPAHAPMRRSDCTRIDWKRRPRKSRCSSSHQLHPVVVARVSSASLRQFALNAASPLRMMCDAKGTGSFRQSGGSVC